MNFQIILRIGKPDGAVLNRCLKRHCPAGECAQLCQLFIIQIPDGKIFELRTFIFVLLPPDLRRALVLGKQRHFS